MPGLARWFLRTSLLQIGVGYTLGALMLANKGYDFHLPVALVLPLHVETLLIGGMVQFAMGVGFWIFPRFRTGPERGAEGLAWAGYLLLNTGVLATGVAAPVWNGASDAIAFLGRTSEWLGATCYAFHLWHRVKPFGGGPGLLS